MIAIGSSLSVVGLALASPVLVGSVQAGLYQPAPPAKASVGITLPLGRCINLGGELETGGWTTQVPPPQSRFDAIRLAGFRTIRLPIKWDTHTGPKPDEEIDPRWFALVDGYVEQASRAGLNVIIDIHHFRALDADPAGNADRFVSLWDQIARHYAAAPPTVWFELLNEPHDKVTEPFLKALYTRALQRIRATNPTRPVIAGGAQGSSSYALPDLDLPDDPYIIPEFHSYAPLRFTHQGAYWVKPALPIGATLSPTSELQTQMQQIGLVKAYMQRTGRVPVMLEFGAIRFAPREDRVRYYRAISSAMASIGVYSCAWNDSTFPLITIGKGDQELIRAIVSPADVPHKSRRRSRT